MRQIQFSLGNLDNGVAVDTRGYERGDVWHLSSNALAELGETAAHAFHGEFGAVPEASSLLLFGILLVVGMPVTCRRRIL